MSPLEAVANAAKSFVLTYERVLAGYRHPDAVEVDLEILEDEIRAYRRAGEPRDA